MVGNATNTMVMSKSNMNVAAHTTTKVHHFFSMPNSMAIRLSVRHIIRNSYLLSPLTTIFCMETNTLDALDRQIIQELYVYPRAPFSRLAEIIGSSEQTVSRRYRRLFDDRTVRVVGQLDTQRV